MAANPKNKNGKPTRKQLESASDSEAVERYLSTLVHPLKPTVEALRTIVLKADARITEGIKWNAPSFYCRDWFATFDLRAKDWVQIIFHRGAKAKPVGDACYVKDPASVLKWITKDRCVAKFVSKEDVASKATAFTQIVAEWVQNLSDEAKQA
jgi:hypothetical protein